MLLTKLHRNFSFIGKTEDTNIISVMLNLTVGQCQRYSVELDISHFGFECRSPRESHCHRSSVKLNARGVILNLALVISTLIQKFEGKSLS